MEEKEVEKWINKTLTPQQLKRVNDAVEISGRDKNDLYWKVMSKYYEVYEDHFADVDKAIELAILEIANEGIEDEGQEL